MTAGEEGPPSDPADELQSIASRAIRVALAIIQLMLAATMLMAGVSVATIRHALPAPPGTDVQPTATVAWGPGVAAAVLSGLALLASIGWLVWNIRARPRLGWWLLAVAVSVADLVLVLGVSQLSTPAF